MTLHHPWALSIVLTICFTFNTWAQNSDTRSYIGINIGVSDFATLDSSLTALTTPTKCDSLLTRIRVLSHAITPYAT